MTASTINKLKQPPALKFAALTALCERFGFYVLSYMLVLYAKAEYGLSDTAAFDIFAIMTALSYMLPAIGGYFSDNFVGIRRCIILGLIIEGSGLCLLAIPSHILFPIALAMVVMGVGLFKIGPTNLLGRAYTENDSRIDSGFTLYYTLFNIGGFVSSIVCGIMERYFGWHVAFLFGGVGIFMGLVAYYFTRHTVANLDSPVGENKLPATTWAIVIIVVALVSLFCAFLLSHLTINNIIFGIVGISLAGYYAYEIIKSTHCDKLKIIACLMMIFIGMIYFILYFQSFTSMELFIHRVVNRNFFGFNIPTEAYLGLNSAWVIILGPMLAFTYKEIAAKYGKDLSVTIKFGIGLLMVSSCFFSLVFGAWFAGENAQVSSIWIIISFGVYTLGEMLISALGVAMVASLVPKRMYGITMGAWFYGCSLAALLSGKFAGLANIPDAITNAHTILTIYTGAFLKIGICGLIATAIVFAIGPYIKRMGNLS
ncbi:MAG: oligopeptide:H+ symporter [Gammaproteobacteria bacterium]|nr:oligopeptide:H+ symporter [Gammaproteobacteria bacterium]